MCAEQAYDVSISDTMTPGAQLVATVAGGANGEPGWGVSACRSFTVCPAPEEGGTRHASIRCLYFGHDSRRPALHGYRGCLGGQSCGLTRRDSGAPCGVGGRVC